MYVNVRALIERDGINGKEIVIQKRIKPNESGISFELPGGQLKEYESIKDCLIREVMEETGLSVDKILGIEKELEVNRETTSVEVLKPFSVYQTLEGPVDSLGIYFRCTGEGTLLKEGDQTSDAQWINVIKLMEDMKKSNIKLNWVDEAGLLYYFKWLVSTE